MTSINQAPLDPLIEAIVEGVSRRILAKIGSGSPRDQKLMSVKEAAGHLGRTASSVRGLIASGDIPAPVIKRIGSRVYLLKRELDAWIDAQ